VSGCVRRRFGATRGRTGAPLIALGRDKSGTRVSMINALFELCVVCTCRGQELRVGGLVVEEGSFEAKQFVWWMCSLLQSSVGGQ
jgi:hypothetical protein